MISADLLPHISNSFWMGDRISNAADYEAINAGGGDEVFSDPFFGHSWSWTPPLRAALYGRTEVLPETPVERYGTGAFLRVPYRRIPIIEVDSVEKLLAIARGARSEDDAIQGMWRGQNTEHYIIRSEQDRLRLYGEPDVLEPSLLPSASRAGVYFPHIFEAWAGLLDLFMGERIDEMSRIYRSAGNRFQLEHERFRSGYNYRLWGLATAQHYGLPSVGLDLTTNIEVALFFALHRFSALTDGAVEIKRVDNDAKPVIYGLGGFEYDLLDDAALSPPWLQVKRPKAQHAHFYCTAWGHSSNKAAERIYVALRLVNHARWRCRIGLDELFPNAHQDEFLDFLMRKKSELRAAEFISVLKRIYYRA